MLDCFRITNFLRQASSSDLYSVLTRHLFDSPVLTTGYKTFSFQTKMSRIPSLLEVKLRPVRPGNTAFHVHKLKTYECLQCGASFEKDRNLKEHIRNVHVKKIKCDFCNYRVAPRRMSRLTNHMQKKHNFPAPVKTALQPQSLEVSTGDPGLGSTVSHISLLPIVDCDWSGVPHVTLPSSLPPSPIPTRSSTPVQDELPFLPLYPDFESESTPLLSSMQSEVTACSSALPDVPAPVLEPAPNSNDILEIAVQSILPTHPSTPLDHLIQSDPAPSMEPVPTSDTELEAAVQSIISDPELENTLAPIPDPDPETTLISIPDPTSDQGLESQPYPMTAEAGIQVGSPRPHSPEFLASELPPTGPSDPRYFFYGAPSEWDDSPHARLISEARERAMRGWSNSDYSVNFTAMNLFAIQKVESVRLSDGTLYSLASYWVEPPQPLI